MSGRLISTRDAMGSGTRVSALTTVHFWTAGAFVGFTLSALCFILATVASILTFAGIIVASVAIASCTVTALVLAFICAFFGAHALDRLAEMARINRTVDDEVLYEIFTPDAPR